MFSEYMPQARYKISNYFSAIAIVVGTSIAAPIGASVWFQIQAIGSAQQDNAAWVFSQLEVEYLKTRRAIEVARSGTDADLDNLRKHFDMLYSRTDIVGRVKNNTVSQPDITLLRDILDRQLPLIEAGNARLLTDLDIFERALVEIEDLPRQISITSRSQAADISEAERQKIIRLIGILAFIVVLVAILLVGMFLRLWCQKRTLKRKSIEAHETQLRLATTLRASLDGIVVFDDHGIIRDFNGSAVDIFGVPKNVAIGRSFVDILFPEEGREFQQKRLDAFRETGILHVAEKGRLEAEMIDQTGRLFPVELSVTLAETTEGPIFVAYVRDITDKVQKEADILHARDQALQAYREKSRFFAVMSHEMRTPLNGLLSAIHLLDDGKLDAKRQGFLNAALTSGGILLGHINDVLTIESTEADTEDHRFHPCDIMSLTSSMVDLMRPLSEASGSTLHIDQVGLDDRLILTAPRSIQQIVLNLLSNATKFSPNADITLRAFYDTAVEGEVSLHLEVIDEGPGIPEDDIGRIFEDFVSLDNRYERRTSGTGLGLGIVKRLVDTLSGEIRCESEIGHGSRFIVDLPVTMVGETDIFNAAPQETCAAPKAPHVALNILVVDDNEINRSLLKEMLQRLGHTVVTADGGQTAIAFDKQKKFDTILMDISMPGINGIQATEAILNGDGLNKETPIIAVTAHAAQQERSRFQSAGMAAVLLKPLDSAALQAALAGTAAVGGFAKNDQTSMMQPFIDEAQVAEISDLLGHDRFSDRIVDFIRYMDKEVPILIETETLETLQSRAHEFAGMCGMLGAKRLHGLLGDIETACKEGEDTVARDAAQDIPSIWDCTRMEFIKRIKR